MNRRRQLAVASVLIICGLMVYRSGWAAPAADKSQESAAVRIARAQLRMAELTLQKAQAANQKVAGTLVSGMVSQFSDNVEFAKSQLDSAVRTGEVDSFQSCLHRAELALRFNESKLKKASETNQLARGTVQPSDIERMRLGIEISQLRLERGRSLVDGSADAKLQWQFEMLNDEVARLREQTYLLGQNRLQQF